MHRKTSVSEEGVVSKDKKLDTVVYDCFCSLVSDCVIQSVNDVPNYFCACVLGALCLAYYIRYVLST